MSILTMRLNQGIVFSSQVWFFCSASHPPMDFFFSVCGFCLFVRVFLLCFVGSGFFLQICSWVEYVAVFQVEVLPTNQEKSTFEYSLISYTADEFLCLHLKFKCHLCLHMHTFFEMLAFSKSCLIKF